MSGKFRRRAFFKEGSVEVEVGIRSNKPVVRILFPGGQNQFMSIDALVDLADALDSAADAYADGVIDLSLDPGAGINLTPRQKRHLAWVKEFKLPCTPDTGCRVCPIFYARSAS